MDDRLKQALATLPGVTPVHLMTAQMAAAGSGVDFAKIVGLIVQYLPIFLQLLSSWGILKPTPTPAPVEAKK